MLSYKYHGNCKVMGLFVLCVWSHSEWIQSDAMFARLQCCPSLSCGLEIIKLSLELYAYTERFNRYISIYLTTLSSIKSGPPCRSRFTPSTSLWCEIETDCAIPISNPRYIKIGESLTRKTLMTELPCQPTNVSVSAPVVLVVVIWGWSSLHTICWPRASQHLRNSSPGLQHDED